ncbi:MAG: hypothetical protein VX630_04610 [Candidatus Neomarinimicrobiota bacterium]|nr:hypothetical protein [Candidatus Neomarinimicrobiota bacterium]
MSELNQPESSATDDLSIDKLEKVVESNKDLYDELNKLTEVEAVEAYDTGEEAEAAVQEEKKAVSAALLKIKKAILKKEWPFRKFPFRNLQGFFHLQPLAER